MSEYTEHFIKYPFVRCAASSWEGFDNLVEFLSWRPGCTGEECDQYADAWIANGVGQMVITEIDRHKLPAPYPERVFYLREWIDPDGRRFGKRNLRIMSLAPYSYMLKGYRYEYELDPDYEPSDVYALRRKKAA